MFENIIKYTDLKYHYVYNFHTRCWEVHNDENKLAAIAISNPTILQESSGVINLDIDILQEFHSFQNRPEYKMMNFLIPKKISEFPDVYGEVLAGAALHRARYHKVGCDPDEVLPQVERCLTWLSTTDFFTAPASTIHHDSFAGGLCYHSLRVVQRVIDLMHTATFGDISRLGDAILCALVHDWCKINLYESYSKNIKNENTGAWEKVQAYRYTGKPVVTLGHGVSSMFLANKFFRLSTEEAAAIRWHMGAWRVADSEYDELQESNEQFMLVHLIQFADQLSLVKY